MAQKYQIFYMKQYFQASTTMYMEDILQSTWLE